MTEEELNDPWGNKRAERERQEREAQRKAFLADLFGTPDLKAQIAPPDPVDHDALLEEHLAQLRNAVRYLMQYAIGDAHKVERNVSVAGMVTNMVRANLALTKALRVPFPQSKRSKTVRGVPAQPEPQD